MRIDACDVARMLGKTLAVSGGDRLIAEGRGPAAWLTRAIVRRVGLRPLARRLAASRLAGHREIAVMLAAAIKAGDDEAALALVSTAGRRPDLRAEKILSRRYGFLWICNPKVASRSMISALCAADPDALLIRGQTLDRVLARHPEAKSFYRFAFLRHPCHRTYSFYADKHALAERDRDAYRWFIKPYYGIRLGMGFKEVCAWLNTPCGSDAFADRHWLSQSRQIADGNGRLPDFLGSYENLEADWETVTRRLRLPPVTLPRLNEHPEPGPGETALTEDTVALLRHRYAEDFRLGGYAEDGRGNGPWR